MLIPDKNYGSQPHDCPYCRWWDRRRKRCGKKGPCSFDEKMTKDDTRVKKTPCDDCPYGVGRTCVGFCMRKIVTGKEVALAS